MNEKPGYMGNPNLLREGEVHSFTKHEVDEFMKCHKDPVYFAETYMKIVTLDHGVQPFRMWDFQKEMMTEFHQNRFVVCKLPRQMGKSTTSVGYMLHYILFNSDVMVAILANKASISREILGRLQLAYEKLPKFLQQGIKSWNKGSIELGNGSKILAESTSASSVRGYSFNMVFLDEFAHVENNLAEEFFESTFPTISSGTKSKVIVVSTPKGMNHFYAMWQNAINGKSGYKPLEYHWSKRPGRDQAWKDEMVRNTSEEQFSQEFDCEFLGSSNTLISAAKLKTLTWNPPIHIENDLFIYEQPIEGHEYVMTVDVSEGLAMDYSVINVMDVSSIPYKQVAIWRSHRVSPFIMPGIVKIIGDKYNEAHAMIEVNSIGLQVAMDLKRDLEYDNVIRVASKSFKGQFITNGFGKSSNLQYGLKMSVTTKRVGCTNLKSLIENDKILLQDENTIRELFSFVGTSQTYRAEQGKHDDCVMSLVIFGWLANQSTFKSMFNSDVRREIEEQKELRAEREHLPFGIVDNGVDDPFNPVKHQVGGDVWLPVDLNDW